MSLSPNRKQLIDLTIPVFVTPTHSFPAHIFVANFWLQRRDQIMKTKSLKSYFSLQMQIILPFVSFLLPNFHCTLAAEKSNNMHTWNFVKGDWGCRRKYFDLKWQGYRESCTVKSFITSTLHQLLFWWASQGG